MGGTFSTYARDDFFIINPREDGMLEDERKDGKMKNALSFEGTGFKTEPLFMFIKNVNMHAEFRLKI
jgi:hypothetical protein